MSGHYVGWIFVKWRWDVRIDCIVRGEVNTVIHFLYLHTVVLPIILLCDLLELNHTNIVSFFYLREQAIIKPWASL